MCLAERGRKLVQDRHGRVEKTTVVGQPRHLGNAVTHLHKCKAVLVGATVRIYAKWFHADGFYGRFWERFVFIFKMLSLAVVFFSF